MYQNNLERKPCTQEPKYIVRAGIDTVLLSNATNTVFTKVRLTLPLYTTGIIGSTELFSLKKNQDIIIQRKEVFTSDKNLVVKVENTGPLDVYIKKSDIIAEVTLCHGTAWPMTPRAPDLIDFAIFSLAAQKLQRKICARRRANHFTSFVDETVEDEDYWNQFLADVLLVDEAIDESQAEAIQGGEVIDQVDIDQHAQLGIQHNGMVLSLFLNTYSISRWKEPFLTSVFYIAEVARARGRRQRRRRSPQLGWLTPPPEHDGQVMEVAQSSSGDETPDDF
jgi:hypothetical protein